MCRGSTVSGVDSIKVDHTFVMFPSFRMLSQSFYQWADHRDSERGNGEERKSIQQAREMFLQLSAVGLWTKNSLLKRVLCILAQTHFVGFALFSFSKCTLIICSTLCVIFQGGDNLENSKYVSLIAFIIRLTPLHSATKAAD